MKALLPLVLAFTVALAADASAAGLTGTLRYDRSGGFAGISERLTVRTDGRATVRIDGRSRTVRLKRTERDRVARLVRHADIATVKVRKAPPAADAFAYSLAYRGHRVEFEDTNFPKRLEELVNTLADLVDKYGRPR